MPVGIVIIHVHKICIISPIALAPVGVVIIHVLPGAYEPPEGRKERPTPHYSVERHLNLNGRDTSLIWTYSQVGRKCCFHSQSAMPGAPRFYRARIRRWRQ